MDNCFTTCRRFLSETKPCPHINETEALSEIQDLLELGGTVPSDTWEEALEICRRCGDYLPDYRA